jgi:hypothetical protein
VLARETLRGPQDAIGVARSDLGTGGQGKEQAGERQRRQRDGVHVGPPGRAFGATTHALQPGKAEPPLTEANMENPAHGRVSVEGR